MNKHFIAMIISLSILAFIAGCRPKQTDSVILQKEDVTKTEIHIPEPNEPESVEIVTSGNESGIFEPNEDESAEVEPIDVEPQVIEPNIAEPNIIEIIPIEPVEKEPNKPEQKQEEPNDVETIKRVAFHNECADILSNFVDKNGFVDYSTLRRKRLQLKKVLGEFAELEPNKYKSWSKEDRIAFWINAYNIQMLNIIVDNYPIEASRILSIFWGPYSIRYIKGIWTDYKLIVMGEEFTLSEIERRIFGKEFGDPRIFFAISYSCMSGPPLRNEPYYGDRLEEQLQEQTRRFLLSPNGFKIDRDRQKIYLSAILQPAWHGKDFILKYATDKKFKDQVPESRAVLNFITKYVSAQDVHFLELENYTVEFMKYDWTLNDSSIKQ